MGESCDSAVIARFDLDPVVLHYQPMYWAMGHFSRFLPRHSQRIFHAVSASTQLQLTSWVKVAATTGEQLVVVVLMNAEDTAQSLAVKAGPRYANLTVQPHSFHSLTFPAALLAITASDVARE